MTKHKQLRIAILSQDKTLYSTKRLVEAAQNRGHLPVVINPLHCYMNITANQPTVHYRGKVLDDIDVVIPRIAASNTIYGTAVLRQFEVGGVYTVNGSVPILRSRDKLRVHQMLAKHGVNMPKTCYAHSTDCTKELVAMVGAPVVIKVVEGTQGKGVVKVDNADAAASVIDAFRDLDANILIQEFIQEAEGRDIRCFVVGDKVVASMMRQAPAGDFRANIHRGGTATPVKLTAEERSMALRVAKLVGLGVAGVDIIRSKHGPLLLEINSSPGLEGIERASGKDVSSMIIEHLEKQVIKPKKKKEY